MPVPAGYQAVGGGQQPTCFQKLKLGFMMGAMIGGATGVLLGRTNVDAARELLKNSGLPIISAMDLEQAAQRIVSVVESKSEQASA
uniref:ATP-citrate lyase/succinyl-CoA ligase domain-containing protein n=1 Tax=Panagrolaimus sp. JU765 TaxID=591449 RepID=A0AC34Q1Z9_9BILA